MKSRVVEQQEGRSCCWTSVLRALLLETVVSGLEVPSPGHRGRVRVLERLVIVPADTRCLSVTAEGNEF